MLALDVSVRLSLRRVSFIVTSRFAEEFERCFGSRSDVELIVNVLDMRADRLELNAHGFGDFLVLVASGEQCQDFPFPLRQILEARPGRRAVLEETDQVSCNGLRHRRAAGFNLLDRLNQLGPQRVF